MCITGTTGGELYWANKTIKSNAAIELENINRVYTTGLIEREIENYITVNNNKQLKTKVL